MDNPSSPKKLVFLSTDRYFVLRQSHNGVIIRPHIGVGVISLSLEHLYAGRPRMQMI